MNIRLFSVIIAGMLSVVGLSDRSISKPSSDDNTIGNGIKFIFEGCTQITSQDKIICTGNLRSFDGEKQLVIRGGTTTITDPKGKTYLANRLTIGDDFNCTTSYCPGVITLVENVKYKTKFIFTDISSPLSTLPLVSIGFDRPLKYRNVLVRNNTEDISNDRTESSDDDRSSPKNSIAESPQPKAIDRPSTPQPTVNNEPRPKSPVTGIVENLVIRGLNDLFRIPNK